MKERTCQFECNKCGSTMMGTRTDIVEKEVDGEIQKTTVTYHYCIGCGARVANFN